jgi:hypothetical protein
LYGGVIATFRPLEKIFGIAGKCAHLSGRHVEKMKSVRRTIGTSTAGERGLIENSDG